MKRFSVAAFLALVAFFTAGCFQRFPAKYTQTEQFSLPLAGERLLHVTTHNGAITVRSGEVEEVQVTAEKTVWSRTHEEAAQFCEDTKIETKTESSGATVSVLLPEGYGGRANIGVSIEAIVPRKCSLDLGTSNGRVEALGIEGNVEMRTSNGRTVGEDIEGDVVAETSNGAVRLERVSGSVEAVTSNGRVTVRDAGGDIRSRTSNGSILLYNVVAGAEGIASNGSIECALPADASATFSGGTSNGKIRSDFPLDVQHGRLSGKIGEGESSIELRTTNGSILLKRIK